MHDQKYLNIFKKSPEKYCTAQQREYPKNEYIKTENWVKSKTQVEWETRKKGTMPHFSNFIRTSSSGWEAQPFTPCSFASQKTARVRPYLT